MASTKLDIHRLDDVVSEKILFAMRMASAQLDKIGVRHALAGGLAVGAWGYPRATKDVDFLVGDEAFKEWESGLITLSTGVPIQIRGIAVDSIPIPHNDEFLLKDVTAPKMSDGFPVISVEGLIFLKLKSPRKRDALDIVVLLQRGIDPKPVRKYLELYDHDLLEKFDALVAEAEGEEM